MKKISSKISFFLLISLLFNSCSKKILAPGDSTQKITLPSDADEVIKANNHFAFDFLHSTLLQDQAENNKLISPLSIYLALSMVNNGAQNTTRDSINKTLRLPDLDINTLNSICQALISQLPKEDKKVQMEIANSIWYRQNSFQPLPSFLDVLKSSYYASAQGLDFDSPSAVKTINDWVSLRTDKKIPTIIQDISPDDVMYLINAIYFNGSWQHGFKTSDTQNDNFYLQDGSTKSVPFMNQKIKANIYNGDLFSIIELPYGEGKSFSMYILEPTAHKKSIGEFASSIDVNSLTNAITMMDSSTVELKMPKWEYSYEVADMKPELSSMGI